jgi:hypothetical protein
MKPFCLTTMIVVLLLLCSIGIQAQETVTTSGGNATGSGGTISYTVGQIVYTTHVSTTGIITQGVQQPYEILVITGIEEAQGISLEISTYPNPVSDVLTLKVENYKSENLTYQLYDVHGSLLQNGEIVLNETIIQTENLAPAVYYLKVSDDQKEVKTFKIIKY